MGRRPSLQGFGPRRRRPWLALVLFLVAILISGFYLLDLLIAAPLRAEAEAQVKRLATEIVHRSVLEEMERFGQGNLVKVYKDGEGRPVLMEPDVVALDKLQSRVALTVNRRLEELKIKKVTVPLGTITRITWLAAWGPGIKVEVWPTGAVKTEIKNEVKTAGINQTRHVISLMVETQLQIVVPPFTDRTVPVHTEVLLTNLMVVGPVPQFYGDFGFRNDRTGP
ncbi:sporulation protein YunB [Carboxydocella sporoproducens DSM 16521]|uniref:Sporulation protein YunB n=2 Tax=Carboxydocella TaxID=178898 RepID=A0A1T4S4Z7_9FIRM|nr:MULTISPECIES: sporulation protein YunB [Carboxydocella]AVX21522.1 sporulation protein YunB [Carboxydocella thermautotrophica]SKA23282.1 sporulation protein YunB [Carboxydocella sporoproducens DSM 16521]